MNPISAHVYTTTSRYGLSRPNRKRGVTSEGARNLTPTSARLTSTSGRLLTGPGLIGSFSLGLQCACGQRPRLIRSRVSLAAWHMSANVVLGCGATLRRRRAECFTYKWAYLAPGSGGSELARADQGVLAPWIFALDHYDPGLVDLWSGADLSFA